MERPRSVLLLAIGALIVTPFLIASGSPPIAGSTTCRTDEAAAPASTADTDPALYGSGFAMDSKNNYQVGWTDLQRVAYRFRAGTTSALTSVAVNQRGGDGYSDGDGGTIAVSVEGDDGGQPDGVAIASLSFQPGNPRGPWEHQTAYTFPAPPTLTAGTLYHVVFTNVGPSPTTDYISLNQAFVYDATVPRQAAFSDDFAVLIDHGSGWAGSANDTPVVDLAYADGHHDGNAYFAIVADRYAVIAGDDQMVRECFTLHGAARTVTSAAIRLKRIDGDGALTVVLETAAGTGLATGTVPASAVPVSALPTDEASLAGSRWVTATLSRPVTLSPGATYDLRLVSPSGSEYVAIPIREQDATSPAWGSRAFRDGWIQRSRDGETWHDVYSKAPLDLQFYLR